MPALPVAFPVDRRWSTSRTMEETNSGEGFTLPDFTTSRFGKAFPSQFDGIDNPHDHRVGRCIASSVGQTCRASLGEHHELPQARANAVDGYDRAARLDERVF